MVNQLTQTKKERKKENKATKRVSDPSKIKNDDKRK